MDEHYEYDDFESKYSDEFDALQDLEECSQNSSRKLEEISSNIVQKPSLTNELPCKTTNKDAISSRKRLFDQEESDDANYADPEFNCKELRQLKNEPEKKRSKCSKSFDIDSIDDCVEETSDDVLLSRPDNVINNHLATNRVYKRIPDGNFVPVTGQEGTRVYLKLKKTNKSENVKSKYTVRNTDQMLSQPFCELYTEVQDERSKKLKLESVPLSNGGVTKNEERKMLWVEQYKPRSFIQLLSDDGTNRTLLEWLKLWDKVVFNRERKARNKNHVGSVNGKSITKNANNTNQKFNGFKNKKASMEISDELDQFNRPMQKIALLCGAPGLGKTTLAHIIAKHAGYNVIELNASDDRSIDAFRTRIEAATQMKAVMGQDPRPNCLIIDEIDGAPANSINLLIQYTKSTGSRIGKQKKKDGFLLIRPIICICNDQFVPALRPLRLISLMLNFPPTLSSRLATRLLEVARLESMDADVNIMYALCRKAFNDIRSCLSTLQFIRCKKQKVTMNDILSASVGRKDENRSLFSVCQEIFRAYRHERKSLVNPHDLKDLNKNVHWQAVDRVESLHQRNRAKSLYLLQQCQSCGEPQRLIDGMFENYLHVNFKDSGMLKVSNGADWLCYSDLLQQELMHSQNYILMPYLPYTCAAFHVMFSVLNPPWIKYPTMDNEYRTNRTKMMNTVSTLYSEMPAIVRSFTNTLKLVQDILPLLMIIIQPPLRPVNIQLYSAREKNELYNVMRIMISYNLTYRQERDQDGQFVYVIDPNVEELINFSGLKTYVGLSYTMRQLVSREIELEKMKQSDSTLNKEKIETNDSFNKGNEKCGQENNVEKKPSLNLKTVAENDEKPEVDFFGRAVDRSKKRKSDTTCRRQSSQEIWFKFKEGYNNAVRKIVRIQDMM